MSTIIHRANLVRLFKHEQLKGPCDFTIRG